MKFSELEQMVKDTREFLDRNGIDDDNVKVINEGSYSGTFDLYAIDEYGFIKTVLIIE